MDQEIQSINVDELVLWTENPRDPIDASSSDQDIVDLAIKNKDQRWELRKLAKEMKTRYDLSELPTVVFKDHKPVVYDGNRRMILAKIKHGLVEAEGFDKDDLPEIPFSLPCNVCTHEVAVENIFRKHGESGSWAPLHRDEFIHKMLGQPKSVFLKLDESTNLIRNNPELNKVYVKDEILSPEKLNEIGIRFEGDVLESRLSEEETGKVLHDLVDKVKKKVITTRKNRGNVIGVLEPENRKVVDSSRKKPYISVSKSELKKLSEPKAVEEPEKKAISRRVKSKGVSLFGGALYLKPGDVSNLYRDINDFYNYYEANKKILSESFPSLIRMALRLLSETAYEEDGDKNLNSYIKKHYPNAKKKLDRNQKNYLHNQNVSEITIVQQIHTGAHKFDASKNLSQTIAISIILGKILEESHGK